MSLAIEEENIPEIQRIHREVLEKGYDKRSIHYQDSTWSISKILLYEALIRRLVDARNDLETSEPIEQLQLIY